MQLSVKKPFAGNDELYYNNSSLLFTSLQSAARKAKDQLFNLISIACIPLLTGLNSLLKNPDTHETSQAAG